MFKMNRVLSLSLIALVATSILAAPAAQANELDDLLSAVADGTASLNSRLRYEYVDVDGVPDAAEARTVKTRLNYKTGEFHGFAGLVEFDNVFTLFGDTYNSTVNGESGYPTVADPAGTDLNQAQLTYTYDNLLLFGGRQRINLDGQRFVGGVGWRQNEQTYDGGGLNYMVGDRASVTYSYLVNVNRVFGPSGPNADIEGDFHIAHVDANIVENHDISAFYIQLNFEGGGAASHKTMGVDYRGVVGPVKLHGAFAQQSNFNQNPTVFDAPYFGGDVTYKHEKFSVGAGAEVLGVDNGVAFSTPFATLHKFQGWADMFLATPGTGLQDMFVNASTKAGKAKLVGAYHIFKATEEDLAGEKLDYGSEFDFAVHYPLAEKLVGTLKLAMFTADVDTMSDVMKAWFVLTTKL